MNGSLPKRARYGVSFFEFRKSVVFLYILGANSPNECSSYRIFMDGNNIPILCHFLVLEIRLKHLITNIILTQNFLQMHHLDIISVNLHTHENSFGDLAKCSEKWTHHPSQAYILPLSLWYMQYHVILDHMITRLDCRSYVVAARDVNLTNIFVMFCWISVSVVLE